MSIDERSSRARRARRHPRIATLMRAARWVVVAAAFALLPLAGTAIAPATAHASFYHPPWPARVKELCLVRKDGRFHLFYTKDTDSFPFEYATKSIGHACSYDLVTWTEYPDVLPVRPGKFDDDHVWSPNIVQSGGLYWMTYTGVTNIGGWLVQKIGLASSPDLMSWTRLDTPVLDCGVAPWAECTPSVIYGSETRDAFVLPDPSVPGGWLMAYATHPGNDSTAMVIAMARSSGALDHWTDATPAFRRHGPGRYGSLVENPVLFQHAGRWFLFYHTDSGHPINYEIGSDPLADSLGWSPMRRFYLMDPSDSMTDPWFGPEYLNDFGREYFAAANSITLGAEFHRMVWTSDSTFAMGEPNVGVEPPAPPGAALRLAVDRSIMRGSELAWSLTLPSPGLVRIDVVDVLGRHVQTLVRGSLRAGENRGVWDGSDALGREVPAGVYLLDAVTPGGRASARVVRLR